MPRKNNVVTVHDWPKLTAGKPYRGKVNAIRLDKVSNRLQVTVENLDQPGRSHILALQLPVYPGNKAALFFVACGIDTAVGAAICIDEAIDAVLVMRFQRLGPDGSDEFDFEPVSNPPAVDESVPV
jgi:hypothetical protein